MPGVVEAHATEAPALQELAGHTAMVQVGPAGSERKLIDAVCREVVADVKNARSDIASQTIHVLRPVRFAAADRTVVDGVREGIARLKRKTAFEAPLDREFQSMVAAGAYVFLNVNGSKWVGAEWIGRTRCLAGQKRIVLIQWANAVPKSIYVGSAQIHRSTREQTHTVGTQAIRGRSLVPIPRRTGPGGLRAARLGVGWPPSSQPANPTDLERLARTRPGAAHSAQMRGTCRFQGQHSGRHFELHRDRCRILPERRFFHAVRRVPTLGSRADQRSGSLVCKATDF